MNELDATSISFAADSPDPRSLACFFTAWQALHFPRDESTWLSSLEEFFSKFHSLHPTQTTSHVPHERVVNPARLGTLLQQLGPALQETRERGDFIQIWSVAGLGKNEVRNVSVLAWMLDPKQTHGFGLAVYRALMSCLAARHAGAFPIPIEPAETYTVATEKYSLNDSQDRVDVILEGTDFLVFIECKIYSSEGREQILRYIRTLEKRANYLGKKRFALIYLT